MASQTSVEEEEEISMLQRRLKQAEKEIKVLVLFSYVTIVFFKLLKR